MKKINLAVASTAAILSLCLAVVLPACKKSHSAPDVPETAQVTTVNAAPKVPYLDVYVNGRKSGDRVAYLDEPGVAAPSVYVNDTLSSGFLDLKLTDSTSKSIAEGDILVQAQKNYSLIVYDTLSGAVKKTRTLLLTDDLSLPGTGKVKVRFLNLSPTAPAVDIDLIAGSDSIRLASAVAYAGASPNAEALSVFSPIKSGTYQMKVKTKSGTQSLLLLSIPSVGLSDNKIYTVYLKGLKSQGTKYRSSVQVIQNK